MQGLGGGERRKAHQGGCGRDFILWGRFSKAEKRRRRLCIVLAREDLSANVKFGGKKNGEE